MLTGESAGRQIWYQEEEENDVAEANFNPVLNPNSADKLFRRIMSNKWFQAYPSDLLLTLNSPGTDPGHLKIDRRVQGMQLSKALHFIRPFSVKMGIGQEIMVGRCFSCLVSSAPYTLLGLRSRSIRKMP
jgi:hypothetical protein